MTGEVKTNQLAVKELRPWAVYLVCLAIALVFLFLFGLDSPLHTFNPHCDYQWFTTMGRGILAGKVPYRDLFEQKGPMIFVLFAVANLLPEPQIVIWCCEVLLISLFLYFCYRIARKFLSPWLSLLVVPLMMMLLSMNKVRGLEGACVEEYCLPIFAYGLLCFLDFLLERKAVTWRRGLALGICIGILFWTKFTLLEFFIIPLLIWAVVNLVEHKFLMVVRSALMMLLGMVIVTLPIIIWFAVVNALGDLWQVYFVINFSNYSGDVQNGVRITRVNPWVNLKQSLLFTGTGFLLIQVLGLICFTVFNWRKNSGWQLLIAVLGTWLMIGFFCGYLYYYLPLYTYAVIGVIYLVKGIGYVWTAMKLNVKPLVKALFLVILSAMSLVLALPFVSNLKEINRPRNQYAPLVVADMIAEYNQTVEKPATLFCYRMVDCGFYNAASVVPNVRYYAQNSFTEAELPEMFASFDDTIRNQLCDFVIMYRFTYEIKRDFIANYYHPYVDNNVMKSSLLFAAFEPNGYVKNEIVILFRND
ncbi:MAG: hypothetical protein J5580_00300 [Clostridia bacterium]|nr:hypothetical protein [Clostridia bacterium]